MKKITNYILSIGAILMLFAHSASAQSTAFTYQGSLNQGGTQAVGYFDFEFRLFDDIIDGDQLGTTLTLNAILVNNGVFSVTLDFGDHFPGAARFLDISVRQTGEAGFTHLSPRKVITNVPYAVRSMVAENAENAANAENAMHATTAETADDSANLNGQPAEFYQSASNLATGTLADARLSANVALLNVPQTFTAVKTYSGRPRFTVTVGPPFEVTNTAKVTNLNADLIDGLDSSAFLQAVPNPLNLTGSRPVGAIIEGTNSSPTGGIGILGESSATTDGGYGVYGIHRGTSGSGVIGVALNSAGFTRGVYGASNAPNGNGILGLVNSLTGSPVGVYGITFAQDGIAVRGDNDNSSVGGRGVFGRSAGPSGRGVFGQAGSTFGTNYGVAGQSNSSSGWGVYSFGNSGASGTKSFRIDHPDDPSNKYLLHYSAESPEVLNIYSGSVTFDENGEAVVRLPNYFTKINKDPRYLLTAVGAPMPMLHVAEEISSEALEAGAAAQPGQATPAATFKIAGGMPGAKASWEVKAVRNDQWTRENANPVETLKQDAERGKYQHPEIFGKPRELGINHDTERRKEIDQEQGSKEPREL